MDVEKFWENREKETGSRLVARTAVNYVNGFEGLKKPVEGGLLYLMENGFYFENFQSTNFIVTTVLKKEFEKVSFHIPLADVIDVYDFFGNRKPVKVSLKYRIIHFFSTKPKQLNIEYTNSRNEKSKITFTTFLDPLLLCEEYHKLV